MLPNADLAFVPVEKLRDYALNPEHPVGKNKAKVFEALLGITSEDTEWLREKILEAVLMHESVKTRHDSFGQRYTVEFELTNKGRKATILTSWILESADAIPRLTTCYVK